MINLASIEIGTLVLVVFENSSSDGNAAAFGRILIAAALRHSCQGLGVAIEIRAGAYFFNLMRWFLNQKR